MFSRKKKQPLDQKIKWIPESPISWKTTRSPDASKKYVPEWFKNIPLWNSEKKEVKMNPDGSYDINSTVKKCVPFMDSFLIGYIQELWCDITFYYNDDGTVGFEHNGVEDPIAIRDSTHLPIGEKFYSLELVWKTKWEPLTPNGYSSLYVHPLNRIDLPFHTLSGVIDTDQWPISGNFPFLLEKSFIEKNGTLFRGTPIYQIIPIKRENWSQEEIFFDHDVEEMIQEKIKLLKSHLGDGYKKEFWDKKSYG